MPCAYIKELKMQFCALALPPISGEKPTNLPTCRHFSRLRPELPESNIRANDYLTAIENDYTLLSMLCLADKQCVCGSRPRCLGAWRSS